MAIKYDNCKDCHSRCVHAGKDRKFVCINGVSCKITTIVAVPVVRCRDCKYWGDEAGKLQHSDGVLFARCKVHNYLIDGRHTGWCPTENDFCSYGERKGR